MRTQAIERLEKEVKETSGMDRAAQIMKDAVSAALVDFCMQDAEFAQAVVEGGSFEECMKAVSKNVGSGISDLEAYRRAVRFYFPGAEIKMTMRIDLVGSAQDDSADGKDNGIILSLEDFF